MGIQITIQSIIRKTSRFSLLLILGGLASCQTTKVEKIAQSPTFSISSGQAAPLKCEVAGNMEGCNLRWTLESGILTHRQVCSEKRLKYTPLMLDAMAKSLKDSCRLNIKYVRLTSKDDVLDERRLAKMMTQSKLWRSYSKAPKAKREEFSQAFLKKVVSVKDLFEEPTRALNSVGYKFKLSKVDVMDFKPIHKSRHFQSLRSVKTDRFVVPQDIRLVWQNVKYQPEAPKKKTSKKLEKTQPKLPATLPDKVM